MTAEKYKNYLKSLTDFELYTLAKKNIITGETGLNLFEWQSELIYNECRTRHPDLYSAALNDAEMMIASRTSSLDDVNISDIFRPSLMTRAEINSLLGNKTENNKYDDITVITNAAYVNNPNYIFCKVSGDSMTQDGIFEDDILIVEKAPPHDGKIIVAALNDALFVKRYRKDEKGEWLCSANDKYPPFLITSDIEFHTLGIVRYVVHSVK